MYSAYDWFIDCMVFSFCAALFVGAPYILRWGPASLYDD